MILGFVIGVGSTLLWPVALGAMLLWLVMARPGYHFPKPLLLVLASIGVTALWSPNPGEPIAWISCVSLAWIAGHKLSRKHLLVPILIVSTINIGIGGYEYISGLHRVRGLTDNASILGMSGLATLPLGGLIVGFSLSRTALLGTLLLTTFHPTRLMIVSCLVAITLNFGIGYVVTPERYTIDGIKTANTLRISAIAGRSPERLHGGTVEPQNRQFKWYGFGHGGYYLSTGQIQPHNVFVLSFWELGLLAVPFWIGLALLWWRHGRNIPLGTTVITCGMFVDEFLGHIEGVFMVLGLVTLTRDWGLTWLHLWIISLLPNRLRIIGRDRLQSHTGTSAVG